MANDRKPFLLRLEPTTMTALKAWAADDLRSLNGQIEFLLRAALRDAGRLPGKTRQQGADADRDSDQSDHPAASHTARPSSPTAREATATGSARR